LALDLTFTQKRRLAWRQPLIDLLAAILRGRRSNSRIAFQATAGGGERFALVLDFDLLPRLALAKKSMEDSDLNFRRKQAKWL
jgi:hypothetical protein